MSAPAKTTILAFLSRKEGPERGAGGTPGKRRKNRQPKFTSLALRVIALFFVLTALILLGIDLLTTLEKQGQLTVRSLQQVWQLANPASLAAFLNWITRLGFPGAAYSFLSLPGWGVFGVLGVLIAFLAGRHPDH